MIVNSNFFGKTNVMKILSVVLFWVCFVPGLYAQWEPTSGPNYYWVNGIKRFGDHTFAGTRGMLFKRLKAESTWQVVVDTPAQFFPGPFFQFDNQLFTYSIAGIYRSGDGNTWEDITPTEHPVSSYYFRDSVIFTVERSQPESRVWRSSNGGDSWQAVLEFSNISNVYFLGKVGNNWYLWVNAANINGPRIFTSDDGGNTWTDLGALSNFSSANYSLAPIQIGDRLYMTGNLDPGIQWTDDGGQTWFSSSSGLPSFGINRVTAKDSVLFCSNYRNIYSYYRSLDGGLTWNPIAQALGGISNIFIASDALYLFTYYNSLYRSTDYGVSWQWVSGFTADPDFRPGFFWESEGWIAFFGYGGIYLSKDQGLHWQLDREGMVPLRSNVSNIAHNQHGLFALSLPGMHRSNDSGQHWTSVLNGFLQLPLLTGDNNLTATSSSLFCVVPSEAVYRSTDQGENWQVSFPGVVIDQPFMITGNGNTVWMLATNRKVFKTEDDGLTWEHISTLPLDNYSFFITAADTLICGGGSSYTVSFDQGLTWEQRSFLGLETNFSCRKMTFSNGRFYARGTLQGATEVFLGYSTDLIHWEKRVIPEALPSQQIAPYDVFARDSLIVVPFSLRQIFLSRDYGLTWEKLLIPLEVATDFCQDLASDGEYLYAGTAISGVWRSKWSDLLSSSTYSPEKQRISIQVSPNPASDRLAISYFLAQNDKVRIALHNLQGQLVHEWAPGHRSSGWMEEVLFIPTSIPSGNYILRLETSNAQGSAKVLVLPR
ncbi:MAG TPA: hypothetical protein DCF33_04855 [Saprospirales bacterium]|nr:hypothetical protein [Saprospirales bacterium]